MSPDIVLEPMNLEMCGCATEEEMNANVEATIARGYTPITGLLGTRTGKLSICGSAPSLRQTAPTLHGDVLAVNSAIGYLLSQGITPRYGMIWDASPVCATFAAPNPGITYLIGARCHRSVFERLKDCRVIIWHAGGDHNISDFLARKGIVEPLINGGSAGVTRALYLGAALGYREFEIHGADSSFDGNASHVTGSVVPEHAWRIWVTYGDGGTPFIVTPEWAAQTQEFIVIHDYFASVGLSITVRGEGMLPHVYGLIQRKTADERKAA